LTATAHIPPPRSLSPPVHTPPAPGSRFPPASATPDAPNGFELIASIDTITSLVWLQTDSASRREKTTGRREVFLVGDLQGFRRTCIAAGLLAGPSGPANPKVSSSRLLVFPPSCCLSRTAVSGRIGPGDPKSRARREGLRNRARCRICDTIFPIISCPVPRRLTLWQTTRSPRADGCSVSNDPASSPAPAAAKSLSNQCGECHTPCECAAVLRPHPG
jgi:hypothetical protein